MFHVERLGAWRQSLFHVEQSPHLSQLKTFHVKQACPRGCQRQAQKAVTDCARFPSSDATPGVFAPVNHCAKLFDLSMILSPALRES